MAWAATTSCGPDACAGQSPADRACPDRGATTPRLRHHQATRGEKTSGWYSPSPGIVYPTLTYLEEAGHLTSQADGAKKLYTITDEGRAYLEDNREVVETVMNRLAYIGKKAEHMRRRFGEEEDSRRSPPLVQAAFDNLRDVALKRLRENPDSETRIVEVLARAAGELRKE
jgi:DNA-binding PadR family transcriptional regulator